METWTDYGEKDKIRRDNRRWILLPGGHAIDSLGREESLEGSCAQHLQHNLLIAANARESVFEGVGIKLRLRHLHVREESGEISPHLSVDVLLQGAPVFLAIDVIDAIHLVLCPRTQDLNDHSLIYIIEYHI